MNPAAQEFVPRKKRTVVEPTVTQQQQSQTRLRASAPAFVPKASSANATPTTPTLAMAVSAPLQASSTPNNNNVGVASPVMPPPPQYVDPVKITPTGGRDSQLSPSAMPYTPTSANFPASPQSKHKFPTSNKTTTTPPPPAAAAAEQEEKEKEERAEKEKEDTDAAAVAAPPPEEEKEKEEEAPAPAAASPDGSAASEDANNGVLEQMGVMGDAVASDFSASSLPAAFKVTQLASPPPPEPLRFNTVWALHADDHPTPFGAPLAYDPVLVHLVGDVECFWRLWRYLPPPSALLPAFTYHWFRRDIKPNWEHARNKNGGTITIVIFDRDKPGLNSKQTMDDAFMTMLMACCGETLAESTSNLNGIMLKVRQNKPTTLQIWTANSDQRKLKALAGSVRSLLEKVIGPKPLQKLEYFSHQQTQVGGPGSLAGRMKGKPSRITPDYTF